MRTSILLGVFVAMAAFSSTGCSAASDDHQTDPQTDELKKGKPGEEGGMCGGIAGIQCKAGLVCQGLAPHPDASGKCAKEAAAPGEEGGMCGGIAGIQCKTGFLCSASSAPDASGTCFRDPDCHCQG